MSKNKKIQPGFTRQGVRDLNYIKAKSVGIRLDAPPQDGLNCQHPQSSIRYDHHSGCTHCGRCHQSWDFDGRPI